MIFRFVFLASALFSGAVLADSLTEEKNEAVIAVMAAEYALQNKDMKTAAMEYTKAALSSTDVNLAERAARLAMNVKMTGLARQALARWNALAPDSAAMWAMNLRLAMQLGEAESALIFSRKLLSYKTPEHTQMFLDILRAEKTDGGVMSRAVLRDVAANVTLPDNLQSWISVLFLADALDEPIASRMLSEKISLKFPDDARAQVIGASALRRKGDDEAALEQLQKASVAQPQNTWVKQNIVAELAELQAWLEAEKYLASMAQDETTWLQRGSFIMAAKQEDVTEKFYAALLQQEKNPSLKLQFLLGQLSDSAGRWADAERWYRAVASSPNSERALLRLPVVLQKQNRWKEALVQLAALQKSQTVDGEYVRDSYLVEADLWAQQKKYPQAMKALQRGLTIFEDDPLLLYGRAMQNIAQNKIDAALQDLKNIISENDQNAEALNAYGYTLAQHKKQYAQGLLYVEKALKLRPGSAATLDSLGWIKFKLRRYDEALLHLEKAWKKSKDAEIAMHLGELYWALGRKEDAKNLWLAGQKLDPKNPLWPAIKKKYP